MAEARKLTKNEKRRLREKKAKLIADHVDENVNTGSNNDEEMDGNVIIEYISPTINLSTPLADEFQKIFDKFAKPEELTNINNTNNDGAKENKSNEEINKSNTAEENIVKVSKKKKKLASRLTVAELKQLVSRPDVVEAHDVTASDPKLLVYLKASRNTIPIPRHWCAKRKYLQGKRGIEKPPFQLPEFIADTGIAKIRESVMEQEAIRKSKQKARDRVQPKMGRIDIDYQVLHDAFFKFQTKPKLTIAGDLYYEGKEYEVSSM